MLIRIVMACFLSAFASSALAQKQPLGPGGINLPYTFNAGDVQWIIQRGGWLQHQGNNPLFGQAANLTINGQGVQGNFNRGTLDAKTGELVLEALQAGGVTFTRRIAFDREQNYIRYIDIFSNRNAAEQQLQVMMQTSLNFGVNSGDLIADPKKPDANMAWVAQTGNGQSVLELWAGPGTKFSPQVNWQQGNSFVQATYTIPVPANGQAAIVHIHGVHPSNEAAENFVKNMKTQTLLAGVTADVRKLIINFRATGMMLGERELLRGDSLDIVELRTGDQLRGTLSAQGYKIDTGFGIIDLPADRVIGMITAGSFRPRQLLVTREGEIIGGALQAETISIQLSSGQTTAVPLSQVARLGYRKLVGDSDDIAFSKPMIVLRSGDRLAFEPPSEPIEILTRFGKISLPMAKFAAIDLQGTESAVHVATLTDGSRFGGLLQTDQVSFKLAATGQAISLPVGAIAMLQMQADLPEPAADAPTLLLSGGDELVAPLQGELKLDTAFDTLTLKATEITAITPLKESGFDVQVTLWDQTTVSGQLRDGLLACTLAGDVKLSVPLPLLEEYAQPQPMPSGNAVENIQKLVGELGADDFPAREQAEAQLVALGDVVIPVLKELRAKQPLEAQQRIDSILTKLGKEK